MNGVTVRKNNGELFNINVVRYFKLNNFSYLIFSLNEIDDGGYIKLYISKVVNEVGVTITDDVEWNLIKDTIKDIIKRNKDGIPTGLNDLNEAELANMTINDQKVFKLNDSLLQLLSANKNVSNQQEIEPIIDYENGITNTTINNAEHQDIPSVDVNGMVDNENIIPTYTGDADVAEAISNSSVEMPNPPSPDMDSSLYYGGETSPVNNVSSNGEDYKALYEAELKKNEEMLQELKKYQSLINDLKEVLK